VHINTLTAWWYAPMNVNIAPFNNEKARHAVNYAVDRKAMVNLFGGPVLASPVCQVLPPGFPGHVDYCPYTKDPGEKMSAPDMEKAKQLVGYDKIRQEQRANDGRRNGKLLGVGISTYIEMCGLAPSQILAAVKYGAGGWEAATIRCLPTGKVVLVTGTSPHGQGHETTWSQILADALGVKFEDVEVLHGDTAISAQGLDTYGSRSLAAGG